MTELVIPANTFQNNVTQQAENPRTPTHWKQANANVAGAGTVWTPAAGKKYRLMGYHVYCGVQVAAAAATDLGVNIQDSGGTVLEALEVFLPAVSVVTAAGTITLASINLPGNGFLSPAINNTLQMVLSASMTGTAKIWIAAWGTEE
jgi:hypothetical protein